MRKMSVPGERGALHDVAIYLGFGGAGEYLDALGELGEDILDTKKREKYQEANHELAIGIT